MTKQVRQAITPTHILGSTGTAESDTLGYRTRESFKNDLGLGSNLTNTTVAGTLAVTGGQIAFPPTQNPSANANTLDDYEEGTWTPSIGRTDVFGTYTPSANDGGKYTKIGNVVYFACRVNGTNTTASGGVWVISGLPFTSANNNTWGRTTFSIVGADGTPGGTNDARENLFVIENTNQLYCLTLVSGSNYYASGFYYVS